ncbi:Metalloprotease TIKI2 [Labeo rohita]|uniref:Metalloprotease TIKI n=1 Tax=Labeo rohita TaxID=84645 RepID=A0ABQ8MFU9_LABRO|nr:Metalloprotease TIKI2 [Labeo rohita]
MIGDERVSQQNARLREIQSTFPCKITEETPPSHLQQALLSKRLTLIDSRRQASQPVRRGVLFALNQTLLQHESLRAGVLQDAFTTEDLIIHYNCGDLNSIIFNHDTSQLPHFINSSLPAHERLTAQQIDSYLRQELIYKRNERMARRVSALLQRNPTQSFFFAFGAEFCALIENIPRNFLRWPQPRHHSLL